MAANKKLLSSFPIQVLLAITFGAAYGFITRIIPILDRLFSIAAVGLILYWLLPRLWPKDLRAAAGSVAAGLLMGFGAARVGLGPEDFAVCALPILPALWAIDRFRAPPGPGQGF